MFIDSLCRFCVPVFFMISGALFLNANRKIDYKKLYLKNILRLFVCLLVFSFFYNYVYIAFTDHSPNFGDAMTFLSSFGMNTQIEVGGGHLWFIYSLIGLYILSPVIKILVNNVKKKKDIIYILLVIFIFASVIPTLTKMHLFRHFNFLNRFSLSVPFFCYLGYFIIGYYLDSYEIKPENVKKIFWLGLIGEIIIFVGTLYFSIKTQKLSSIFFEYYSFPVFFTAIAIFVLIKEKIGKLRLPSKFIIKISSYTFGIYLIHRFIINIFSLYGIISLNHLFFKFPLIMIILSSVLVFLISMLYSILISKIPILNKYLM